MAGGITQTGVFLVSGRDKPAVRAELRCALKVLIDNDVDLIIVEVRMAERHANFQPLKNIS